MTQWRMEDWVTIIQHTRVIWSPINIDHIIYIYVLSNRRGTLRGFSATQCSVRHGVELGMIVYLHIARCTGYYVIFSYRVPPNTVSHMCKYTIIPSSPCPTEPTYCTSNLTRGREPGARDQLPAPGKKKGCSKFYKRNIYTSVSIYIILGGNTTFIFWVANSAAQYTPNITPQCHRRVGRKTPDMTDKKKS